MQDHTSTRRIAAEKTELGEREKISKERAEASLHLTHHPNSWQNCGGGANICFLGSACNLKVSEQGRDRGKLHSKGFATATCYAAWKLAECQFRASSCITNPGELSLDQLRSAY